MNSDLPPTIDPTVKITALEMAAERLAGGFVRCLQDQNGCEVTGRFCGAKCGCRDELKEWCGR